MFFSTFQKYKMLYWVFIKLNSFIQFVDCIVFSTTNLDDIQYIAEYCDSFHEITCFGATLSKSIRDDFELKVKKKRKKLLSLKVNT